MKRTPITPNQVYRSFPLFFWQHCSCCKQEFRRERGWRYVSGPYHGGSGHWRYLCGACAPNREAANQLVLKGVHIPKRPPAPPAMRTGVQRP